MIDKRWLLLAVLFAAWFGQARGEETELSISAEELPRLLSEIKPQPGESPWREVNWLTNVTEARQRAAKEDKPIVIFVAADGSPLSRT